MARMMPETSEGCLCHTDVVYFRNTTTDAVDIQQFNARGENIDGNHKEKVKEAMLRKGFVELSHDEVIERCARKQAEKKARELKAKEDAARAAAQKLSKGNEPPWLKHPTNLSTVSGRAR